MTPLTGNPFDNPEFRAELSKMFDDKLGDIRIKVDAHEVALQRGTGAKWLFNAMVGALLLLAEYLFHRK